MNDIIKPDSVKRIAGLELNALLYSGVLPKEVFEGARVLSSGQKVFDINGEMLFYRVPVQKGSRTFHVDIAANPALGSPVLAIHSGLNWKVRNLQRKARDIAKREYEVEFDHLRFVAFSFPKIAFQFTKKGTETLMLELHTWKPVPSERLRAPDEPPSNFERWSLLEEIPDDRAARNIKSFTDRIRFWDDKLPPYASGDLIIRSEYLVLSEFKKLLDPEELVVSRFERRELRYSLEDTDHNPCYELRRQPNNHWCVAASVQMLLDFYRYNYSQERIAQELQLGNRNHPKGLPYARGGDVVTVIERLSSQALDANMNTSPNWAEFRSEIRANRPLISVILGHSRTVAGYARSRLGEWLDFRGLLVYDPHPPPTGKISLHNFDTITYEFTFTAQPTLA